MMGLQRTHDQSFRHLGCLVPTPTSLQTLHAPRSLPAQGHLTLEVELEDILEPGASVLNCRVCDITHAPLVVLSTRQGYLWHAPLGEWLRLVDQRGPGLPALGELAPVLQSGEWGQQGWHQGWHQGQCPAWWHAAQCAGTQSVIYQGGVLGCLRPASCAACL